MQTVRGAMADNLIGKIIGGYEILDQIGQGGMATVYVARQQSMNRQVAIKVLPRQFLNDDTYLQRFEQEVNIVSKLEHRNIVPVYDYGEHDGQPYIVMRYMPAGSVDDLIRTGALPPEQIVSILSQIAPALDYAHNKGILHRDLKPSNVLMDDDGGAFLTDFGIARILGEQGTAITTQGVVGTPSYMSPEQAQGHDLDGRSDLYSVGVMLFEMATGRRPFESETPYSIAVMQVNNIPPSPRDFNTSVTTAVEWVILKALKKKREDRYNTNAELAVALELAVENPSSVHDTDPNMRLPKIATQPHPTTVTPPPSAQSAYVPNTPYPTTAPPSSQINRQIYPTNPSQRIRRPKKGNSMWMSIAVGGTLGCALLAGVIIAVTLAIGAFTNDETTATPDLTPSESSGEAVDGIGTSIIEDGTGQPTLDATSEIYRMTLVARNQEIDATVTAIAIATANATEDTTPDFLPPGVRGTPSLTGSLRDVTGSIVYFDRRINDEERSTFEIVSMSLTSWADLQATQDFSSNSYPFPSPDGRRFVFQSDRDGDFEIYVMNPGGGQVTQLTDNDIWDRLPSWSPDGEWIVYSTDTRADGTFDIYRMRPDGTDKEAVYSDGKRNSHPRYSPDGNAILFTTGDPQDASTWEIALLDLTTNEVTLLTNNNVRDASAVFSPDGTEIAYITVGDGSSQVMQMDVDGSNAQVLYDSPYPDWAVTYSPDGNFLMVTSTIEGNDQLILMQSDGSNAQQITTNGGAYATWIP